MYVTYPLADGTFAVGFYRPGGAWVNESNHPNVDEAVARMRFLNGAPLDQPPTSPEPPPPTPHVMASASNDLKAPPKK